MALLGEQVYPRVVRERKDGYVVTARLIRIANDFMIGFAQRGDCLGRLSLRGPGVNISVGNLFSPVNLSSDAGNELYRKMMSKYLREIDSSLFWEIVEKALQPY